jgi:predicted nucleic acid-binding Zn ribbon protein
VRRVRELLERVAPAGAVEAGLVLAAWREVARSVGVTAHLAEFRAGRLTVFAPTASQAQELSMRAPEIARAINARLGAQRVRDVRVLSREA